MAGHKPPPRTLDPQEEAKIQRFLERAAPLVLQGPELDSARWRQLAALAEELQLTPEQLRRTIDDLYERGVLKKVDAVVPKPPPLPSHLASRNQAASPSADSNFSLTPPPARGAKPPQRRTAAPVPAAPEAPTPAAQFLERAPSILARHRGPNPAAQIELAATARDLGLDPAQARQLLLQMGAGGASPTAPVSDRAPEQTSVRPAPAPATSSPAPEPPVFPAISETQADRRKRWRLEEDEVTPPPPPVKEPDETFRDYVRLAFEQNRAVDADRVVELVRHGTTALGLSGVYARHLVGEIAAEKSIHLPAPSAKAAVQAAEHLDPATRAFINEAVPILAEHRGVNARSRVLLNAVARAKNLTDRQFEEALALIQTPRQSDEEEAYAERLAPFREYLVAYLARLSPPILTANVEQTLAEQGRMLYGLRADRARGVIREAARQRKLPVISLERAEHHLRELVTELLGDGVRLPRELRERVDAEGKQWGLSAPAVESIVRELIHSRVQQQKWERKFTSFALLGASLAVLLILAFFTWTMLRGHTHGGAATAVTAQAPESVPARNRDRDDSWWDADLSVTVQLAREEMPQLLSLFKELDASAPERRATAYEQMVHHFLERSADERQRAVLERVLARCYALDPIDENAQRISVALLRPLPRTGAKLVEDAEAYPRMFLAVNAAVDAWSQARENPDRAARLAQALGELLGTPLDSSSAMAVVERQCLAALAERLYHLITAAAATQPQLANRLFGVIFAEAKMTLDEARLQRLNAEFLVELLTAAADLWHAYEHLLIDTIQSRDPLTVIRLLRLYERTTDVELQAFMSGPLLQRAGAPPEPNNVPAIAAEVRRALGAGVEATADARWAWLTDAATSCMSGLRDTSSPAEPVLGDIIRLNYLSTLAVAMTREDAGLSTFEELKAKGPPELSIARDAARPEIDPIPSAAGGTRGSPDQIRAQVDRLNSSSLPDRIGRLESLSRMSAGVPDIAPRQAEMIAAYLLRTKKDEEQRRVLEYVPQLARWKHLRLALADEVVKPFTLRRESLQEMLTKIVGRQVVVGTGVAGGEAARVALLQSVLSELTAAAGGPVESFGSFNSAAQSIANQYATQSRLLGISGADPAAADRPGPVLRQMVEQSAARQRPPQDATQRERLQQIPQRLTAIDYLAADDLQWTALLQREWAFLLSLKVAEAYKDRSAQAAEILRELAARDRKADHVLSQVRDGEAAILRLWLLAGASG